MRQLIADSNSKQSFKRRGNYNCGRCGQPKKGHVCNLPLLDTTTPAPDASSVVTSSTALPYLNSRRTLSFKDMVREPFVESEDEEDEGVEEVEEEDDDDMVAGGLLRSCMWEVMRRLQPVDLMASAKVCTSWRDLSKKVWKSIEELRIRVPATVMVGSVGSVLKKCRMLTRLALKMERLGF